MKKSLLALVAIGFAGAASAQSSVTLFGIVDATLAFGKGSVSNKTQLTNSGYNSSRLGFRATEDLGGGSFAGMWLEAGLTNDDGTGAGSNANNQNVAAFNPTTGANPPVRAGTQGLTFNRRSTVSVGGAWGEIRMGRDYTPHFWTQTVYDPYGTNGVGTTQTLNSSIGGPTTIRASNSIAYLYGHGFNATAVGGNGFHAMIQHYRGENNQNGAATAGDGTGTSIRLGYGVGPFSAALSTGTTKFASGDIRTTNIGAHYDLGVVDLMGLYDRDSVDRGATGKGYLFGGLIPLGQGVIRAAYSRYETDATGTPTTKKYALGYVYNLSKRSALYTTYARVSNSGGAAQSLNGAATAANKNSTGYDFGLRHSF